MSDLTLAVKVSSVELATWTGPAEARGLSIEIHQINKVNGTWWLDRLHCLLIEGTSAGFANLTFIVARALHNGMPLNVSVLKSVRNRSSQRLSASWCLLARNARVGYRWPRWWISTMRSGSPSFLTLQSIRQKIVVPAQDSLDVNRGAGRGIGIGSAMVAAIGNGAPLPQPKGVTSLHGSAWCRSRCPRVIAPSLAAPNVAIAIYARW